MSAQGQEHINKPKLVVFDLDYTLWPFWVDTHVDPPFSMSDGKVLDRQGATVKPYKEISSLLEYLHSHGYELAVASRTGELNGANQLLHLFDWDHYFKYKEIYPGCKVNHFKQLKKKSGYKFDEMLFFDDEPRNKSDLDEIGVLTIIVECGATKHLFDKGLTLFSSRN